MDTRKEELLQTLEIWDRLTENQKQLARESSRFVKYKKGAMIHSCTGSCVGLVLVVSGLLRTYIISEEGREVTLFRRTKGQVCILAASCIINQITFDTTLTAEVDSEVLIISAHAFLRIKEENIYAECYMYKLATERFSDAVFAMQQMLFMGFDKRLALFLLEACGESNTVAMTHEQIAKNTGSAREVVTRMLKRFSEDGIISLKRGAVVITHKEKLKELAVL